MKKIKKNLKWITLVIVMIIVIGVIFIKVSLYKNKVESVSIHEIELKEQETTEDVEDIPSSLTVCVDIKGAVQNPGVYEIEEDKKVIDVVQLAGGFTEQADTSMINLAKKVTDEMVIIIYTSEEVKKALATDSVVKIVDKQCVCPQISNDACLNQNNIDDAVTVTTDENNLININQATLDELLTLSGIGESKAKSIIEYREQNGDFQKIEDIMEVPGIGEALYEKIKANITI